MAKGKRGDGSAYASGMRGSEEPEQGPLDSLSIRVAENGWLLTCNYDPRDGKSGYVAPGKPRVFDSMDELLGAVKSELEDAKEK